MKPGGSCKLLSMSLMFVIVLALTLHPPSLFNKFRYVYLRQQNSNQPSGLAVLQKAPPSQSPLVSVVGQRRPPPVPTPTVSTQSYRPSLAKSSMSTSLATSSGITSGLKSGSALARPDLRPNREKAMPSTSSSQGSGFGVQQQKSKFGLPGTVVCLNGNRGTSQAMETIVSRILTPLRADLIVHFGFKPNFNSSTVREIYSLYLSNGAVSVVGEVDQTPDELTKLLASSKGGHIYRRLTMCNFLSPAFGHPGGAAYQYYNQHRCMQLIEDYEASARGGVKYSRVIWSRADMYWFVEHPPVSALSPNFVWIPTGQDWKQGLNDRHAVCNRTIAKYYLSRWIELVEGRVYMPGKCNAEYFLRAHLNTRRVPFARFPAVSAVVCCAKGRSFSCSPSCYEYTVRNETIGIQNKLEGQYAYFNTMSYFGLGKNWTKLLYHGSWEIKGNKYLKAHLTKGQKATRRLLTPK